MKLDWKFRFASNGKSTRFKRSWTFAVWLSLMLGCMEQLAIVNGVQQVYGAEASKPTWRAWPGLVDAGAGIEPFRSENRVLLRVTQRPANGQVEFPRLNNVVRIVQLLAEENQVQDTGTQHTGAQHTGAQHNAATQPRALKLTQDAKTWRVELPQDCPLPARIELQVDGRPWHAAQPRIVQPSPDHAIVLSAHDGQPFGEKLQFEPLTHKNTIGYWVNPNDWARWQMRVGKAGRYRVRILQGCGAGQGGSRVALSVLGSDASSSENVSEATHPSQPIAQAQLEFDVEATGHFQNFVWRDLGELSLTAGQHAVELRVLRLAKQAVMDVRQIRFEPLAATASNEPVLMTDVEPDLVVPAIVSDAPHPGRRSRQTLEGYAADRVYHALYLPTDWKPMDRYPVIVELAGNGDYINDLGDRCTGTVDDACFGFGITGGHGAIWVTLPFLNEAGTENVVNWWGDPPSHDGAATIKYWDQVIQFVCKQYGGDEHRVVLAGFSRGALACNALGLATDQIANRWAAFVCNSHYDGVQSHWPYAAADREQAIKRLARLGDRSQFICSESAADLQATQDYLQSAAPSALLTFQPTGFRNHSDRWVLRPSVAREVLRTWLSEHIKGD